MVGDLARTPITRPDCGGRGNCMCAVISALKRFSTGKGMGALRRSVKSTWITINSVVADKKPRLA